MSTKIVAKFGGSSVADSFAMNRSAKIVLDHLPQIVVVSATYGTTNSLLELVEVSKNKSWAESERIISQIKDKHWAIAQNLFGTTLLTKNSTAKKFIESLLVELETIAKGINLLGDCSNRTIDNILSIGERLSSYLFTQSINNLFKNKKAIYFDIRPILRTDECFGMAKPQLDEIRQLAKLDLTPLLKKNKIIITQGFIGSTEDGITTTLGRGGGDYSAALIAEAITADILQIWTNVDGISTTDPILCDRAKPIRQITFSEASELSSFGAKILHPTTLVPAVRCGFNVFVGSSLDSSQEGTWILKNTTDLPLVRAIALKKNQSLLTLTTPKMLHAHGFLSSIFSIFSKYEISIDSITTSEISVSLTLDDSTLLNKKLIKELSELATVYTEENLSLVSLIGNKINHTPGLANNIFKGVEDINIRMICLGASKHNFCFLIDQEQERKAINRLHKIFIEDFHGLTITGKTFKQPKITSFKTSKEHKLLLQKAATKLKSSFYSYDLDLLDSHLKSLQATTKNNIDLWYACKANPLSSIIKQFNKNKYGFDVASIGELNQILKSNVPPSKILSTGPAKSKQYLKEFLQKGVRIFVIESKNQLLWLNAIASKMKIKPVVLLRVQLSWDEGTSVLGGDEITPFGLGIDDWKGLDVQEYSSVNFKGFHVFQWGNLIDLTQLKNVWWQIATAIKKMSTDLKVPLDILDLGGGIGIPYTEYNKMPSFKDVYKILMELKKEFSLNKIWMELGRYAVGECGTYCTKVIDKKTVRNRDLLVLDGGVNHLLRPALTGQSFPCEALTTSKSKKKKFHVHGPLCTALDKLGVFDLPGDIECDNWIAFKQTGAYGLTESMPLFLCHDLPAEVITSKGKMKVIRKVGKIDEWLA